MAAMPGTRGRNLELAGARLDRAAWLEALLRAVQRGDYRPDPDLIAQALSRAWWPGPAAKRPGSR